LDNFANPNTVLDIPPQLNSKGKLISYAHKYKDLLNYEDSEETVESLECEVKKLILRVDTLESQVCLKSWYPLIIKLVQLSINKELLLTKYSLAAKNVPTSPAAKSIYKHCMIRKLQGSATTSEYTKSELTAYTKLQKRLMHGKKLLRVFKITGIQLMDIRGISWNNVYEMNVEEVSALCSKLESNDDIAEKYPFLYRIICPTPTLDRDDPDLTIINDSDTMICTPVTQKRKHKDKSHTKSKKGKDDEDIECFREGLSLNDSSNSDLQGTTGFILL